MVSQPQSSIGRMMQPQPRPGRGIFAIGLHNRAVPSKIHRLGAEEPERPTMTTTEVSLYSRPGNRAVLRSRGLCNVTSDGADEAGHAASEVYRHIADMKEAGGLRDEQCAL